MDKAKYFSMLCGNYLNSQAIPLLLAICMIAIMLPGCGGRDLATVTGKVTYNGKPLQFGTVIFEPDSGQYATGPIQADGTFQLKTRGEGEGVPVGRNKVRFVCFSNQDPNAKSTATNGGAIQGEGLFVGIPLIPQKYLSSSTSGIVVDVKPDNNEPFIFNLTDN